MAAGACASTKGRQKTRSQKLYRVRQGLDIATIRQVTDNVTIPVIAAGGCGLARHFSEGFIEGNCEAVSAGTFFCFQDQNIMQTRSHVWNAGVSVRIKT